MDEDFKRYYPYDELASKVLGFTGGDNQGIIGLEVKYDEILQGINGKILTTTDARGIELSEIGESRVEPIAGYNLQISLDMNIQEYCQQAALKVMEEKQADSVSVLLMNPQNGEIYACVNVPEFNLNEPFTLNTDVDTSGMTDEEMCIRDRIEASYRTLGLMSFLTSGEDETRAWTIKVGTKAPQAAGKIHTDFERGFIKAEVVNYQDLLDAGSYAGAREKGLVRLHLKLLARVFSDGFGLRGRLHDDQAVFCHSYLQAPRIGRVFIPS